MKNYWYVRILVVVLTLVPGPQSHASARATQNLRTLLANLQTMQASFTQTVSTPKQSAKPTVGSLLLARPGKLRWETKQPTPQLIIVQNNKLILYDAELMQATIRTITTQGYNNPALLLSGSLDKVLQTFQITQLVNSAANATFILKPKKSNHPTTYVAIKLQFTKQLLTIMEILDNLGQRTVVKFSNQIVNKPIAPKQFMFKITNTMDVINEG